MDIFYSSLNIEFIIVCLILVFLLFCELSTIDNTKSNEYNNYEKPHLHKSNTHKLLNECGVSNYDMKNLILDY